MSNRRVFSERSELAANRFKENGEFYGLVLLDLDNFKLINDRYGHDVGDDVLRALSRVLKDQVRGPNDVIARLGGEEFGVLCLGDLDEEGLRVFAERIRTQIRKETVQIANGIVQFTGSFGLSLSYAEDAGWKNIYARADTALYEAKAAGKDRIVFGKSYPKGTTGRFRSSRIVPNH